MDAGSDYHPDPHRPLLGLGIPYTTPWASKIVPYSHQELPSVPGAFRVTALIDQVPHLLPLGARGLRHPHPVPKRRRRTLQEDRTRSLRVRLNPQDHQESAGRGRQTPSVVVEAQEAILVQEGEALAALRRHTLVVTGAGHEPLRRTPHHDRVSRGSLIEASGSPFDRRLLISPANWSGNILYVRRVRQHPSAQRAADALFPLSRGKNGGKTQLPVVGSTMRVKLEAVPTVVEGS